MPTPAQVEKEQSRDHRTRPSVAIRQPAPGLAESILQGTSANLLGLILTFAQHVLLLPLFLHSWGGRLYGDWLALTAAAGYLSLLEGGFQRYLTNRMNAAWDLGDPKQFHRLLHTGIVFSVAVTGVGAVVVALGAFFIPWPKLLRLSILDQSLSGATLMLAGLSLLASIPAGIVGGVYRCLKEYPRGVSLANLARLLQVLAIAAALWQGKGILTIATLLLLAPLLAMLAGIADIRARPPNVRLGARDASLRLLVKSLRPSLYFLLLPLSHAFWVQGSIIILSSVRSSAVLVVYTTTRTMFMIVRQALNQINLATWPEITRLFAKGDRARVRRLHRSVCVLSVVASGLVCGYLLTFGPQVLRFWTTGKVDADPFLLGLFAAYILGGSVWQVSQIVPLATNHHRATSLRHLGAALCSVAASLWLVPRYGVRGSAAALVLGDTAFLSLAVPKQACRLLGENGSRLFTDLAWRGALALAAGLATGYTLEQFLGDGSPGRLLVATVLFGMAALVAALALLSRHEREWLLPMGKRAAMRIPVARRWLGPPPRTEKVANVDAAS